MVPLVVNDVRDKAFIAILPEESLWTSEFAVAVVDIWDVFNLLISIVLFIKDADKLFAESVKVISFGDVVVNAFKYLLVVPCFKSSVVFAFNLVSNLESV